MQYIYTTIKKNKVMAIIATEMNLESITLSKVGQKEKANTISQTANCGLGMGSPHENWGCGRFRRGRDVGRVVE